MPRKLNISDVEEGMLLVEPVLNSDGSILLKMGTEIEQKHIKFLKMWGVQHVKVGFDAEEKVGENSDESKEIEVKPEIKEKILETLGQRMNWKPELPQEEDLIELAVLSQIKKGEL